MGVKLDRPSFQVSQAQGFIKIEIHRRYSLECILSSSSSFDGYILSGREAREFKSHWEKPQRGLASIAPESNGKTVASNAARKSQTSPVFSWSYWPADNKHGKLTEYLQ